MRIALLSDLHGNLAALEVILADLDAEQVDHIVCLGDVAVGHTFEFTPGSPEERIPPWTEYALVGWADGRLDVEFLRVPIDVNALVRAALNSGMPHAEWWVENWG